ncbi:MAG: hypothetical protein A2030_03090 [Chloroflexi bacterium RBG_19FT_COMBO_50_10]|nr:MAG: hypothetical protein A2030_03090 [Chloroflexi bacterium RBG_19FT_COMBO_50_10]
MKKKTILLLSTLMILIMTLSACSGSSNQDTTSTDTGVTNTSSGGTSLSQVNILLVGTLKLEDTGQAVTADEATKLLPLWQAYRSLSTSQTAAEVEVEALLNQIQSSMTSEQVQAIKAMNLTNTEMMDLMQSFGGGMVRRGTPDPQSTPGFEVPGGGFTMGEPPSGSAGSPRSGEQGNMPRSFSPGGGMSLEVMPGGEVGLEGGPLLQGTVNPSMQATAQARFSTQANQVNSILLDVLISKLEAMTTN